jgi:hypothetical protein
MARSCYLCETAHLSSLPVSAIWFSFKSVSLIWGLGACTLHAEWTITRTLWMFSNAHRRISRSWTDIPYIFEQLNLGLQPREVWNKSNWLPAEWRLDISENTSKPLVWYSEINYLTMSHCAWDSYFTASNFSACVKNDPFHTYKNSRLLRWRGHVAHMPLNRAPRKFLTCWTTKTYTDIPDE